MKPRSYVDEGVVLAKRSFGEADRIISVYSKNHGRVSLLAKGVRRPKSRKRGHVEIFNQIKFQATSTRSIDLMTEAESVDDFSEIRKSLKKVSLAYYFMEVVGRITHEGEKHEELYFLILDGLGKLKKESRLKELREDFVVKTLTTLGFWPKGKRLVTPDEKLEEVIERSISSVRVGKRIFSN